MDFFMMSMYVFKPIKYWAICLIKTVLHILIFLKHERCSQNNWEVCQWGNFLLQKPCQISIKNSLHRQNKAWLYWGKKMKKKVECRMRTDSVEWPSCLYGKTGKYNLFLHKYLYNKIQDCCQREPAWWQCWVEGISHVLSGTADDDRYIPLWHILYTGQYDSFIDIVHWQPPCSHMHKKSQLSQQQAS